MNNLLNLLLLSTASASSMHRNHKSAKAYSNYRAPYYNSPDLTPYNTSNTNDYNNNPSNTNDYNNNPSNTNDYNNNSSNTNYALLESTLPTPESPVFGPQVDALLPNNLKGRFSLPPLPFDYSALEPYIDTTTMRTHHSGHHQNYVNNLNTAISRYPELYAYTLGQLLAYATLLPSDIQAAVINNGGGHYNHTFFFNTLSPNSDEPTGSIRDAIDTQFGSYSNFKRAFSSASNSVFGSGYVWLVLTPSGRLEIITTSNQDTPIPLNLIPLLALDVWEHAHYIKHQNNRDRYVENWFNVINWPYVNSIYEAALDDLGIITN